MGARRSRKRGGCSPRLRGGGGAGDDGRRPGRRPDHRPGADRDGARPRSPGRRRCDVLAAARRRERRALHHRRRHRAAARRARGRALGLRAGRQRRHHRVRRAAVALAGNAGDAYLEVANFAPAAQQVRVRSRAAASTCSIASSTWRRAKRCGRSSRLPRAAIRRCGPTSPPRRTRSRSTTTRLPGSSGRGRCRDRRRDATDWLRAAFERDPGVRATFVTPANWTARRPPRHEPTWSSSIAGRRTRCRPRRRCSSRRRRRRRGSAGGDTGVRPAPTSGGRAGRSPARIRSCTASIRSR